MEIPSWKVSGKYYETCSCDFVCPCILTRMAAAPSKGSCTFCMAFQVSQGHYGPVSLDGLGFIVLGLTPEAMEKGNWSVGLITDERASVEQRNAITAIASGEAGGPMGALAGMIGKFSGIESAPIRFDHQGPSWSVEAGKFVSMAADDALGMNPDSTKPLSLDNTGHPASDRIALSHATRSHVHVLDFSWDDATGKNNGQYAPFSWHSA